MEMDIRTRAVGYFIKALGTGERTAAQRLQSHLADDVEYETDSQPGQPVNRVVLRGKTEVLERVFGLWPITVNYYRVGWSEPEPVAEGLRVTGQLAEPWRSVYTAPDGVSLTFAFDERGQIRRVLQEGGWKGGRPEQVSEIPLHMRGLINNALANHTPMIVTYVDGQGIPHSSMRGSACVFGPTQLAIWVRHGDGGLPQALSANENVSLVYSDRRVNTHGFFTGRAHLEGDGDLRNRVFELAPEVEQTHDPERHGVAVVIQLTGFQIRCGGRDYRM